MCFKNSFVLLNYPIMKTIQFILLSFLVVELYTAGTPITLLMNKILYSLSVQETLSIGNPSSYDLRQSSKLVAKTVERVGVLLLLDQETLSNITMTVNYRFFCGIVLVFKYLHSSNRLIKKWNILVIGRKFPQQFIKIP